MSESGALRVHTVDPAPLIEAAYRRIALTRMSDVPILNPALRVEALDFALWEGHWLGVLVTPWSINLMMLPGAVDGWPRLREGEKRTLSVPAGTFEFIAGAIEDLGEYHSCSLFSPVFEFADHETARLTARAARKALFSIEDVARFDVDALASSNTAASSSTEPRAAGSGQTSRRGFLRRGWR